MKQYLIKTCCVPRVPRGGTAAETICNIRKNNNEKYKNNKQYFI